MSLLCCCSPSPHMPSSQYGLPPTFTASGAAASVAAVSDSVTVDVHDVNLMELKADGQSKTLAPTSDCHMKAIVEVHTEDADLIIVDQDDAVIKGNPSVGTQRSRGGYEDTALEAVDQGERLLTEVGLGEESVTDQHQEVTLEAIHEETSEGQRSFLVEQNEVETVTQEVSGEDTLNVEPIPEEGSCLNSASANDISLLEPPVVPQSPADHESLHNKSETNTIKNGPVVELHGAQSQSEEEKIGMTPVGEETAQADVDECECVEKADQEDITNKVLQSVHLQSLDHREEENNKCVLSNGHTSDSSVMSAIEDSTEEAPECEFRKMISTTVIESVVSDIGEVRTVILEDESLKDCDPKGKICSDGIGQPYTDLNAQVEGTEGDPHGNASQEQVDGLINHMEATA